MYIWIHDKYSSTSFNDKINFWNHVCHCGAVVKELLARADKPGSSPGDPIFCLFVPFFDFFFCFFVCLFFSFRLSFLTLFLLLALFSLFLLLTLLVMHLDQYILSLSPEFYFGKGTSKALDLHTDQAYDQKKNNNKKKHNLSRHVAPLKQLNIFQC